MILTEKGSTTGVTCLFLQSSSRSLPFFPANHPDLSVYVVKATHRCQNKETEGDKMQVFVYFWAVDQFASSFSSLASSLIPFFVFLSHCFPSTALSSFL